MEACVLCDRLLVVCTDSDRTPDSPDLHQSETAVACSSRLFRGSRAEPSHATGVRFCLRVFALWLFSGRVG